jgi:ketosteroid isomerase-like protein
MSNSDVARQVFELIEAQNFDGAAALMTDDFTFEGPVPEPVDRDGFLGLQRAMATAFPDWTFQARDFTEQGDTVNATVSVGGTQTGTLSLPFLGLPDVARTGRSVRNPDEALRMTVRDGMVAGVHVAPVQGGGVPGILTSLGVSLP